MGLQGDVSIIAMTRGARCPVRAASANQTSKATPVLASAYGGTVISGVPSEESENMVGLSETLQLRFPCYEYQTNVVRWIDDVGLSISG
jgi:hypothetical protein